MEVMGKEDFRKMSWRAIAEVLAEDVKSCLLMVAVVLDKGWEILLTADAGIEPSIRLWCECVFRNVSLLCKRVV